MPGFFFMDSRFRWNDESAYFVVEIR
jgi:hypothetical protein